jgi:hypothetical protein
MNALYADTLGAARPAAALTTLLEAVERQLAALGCALRDGDAAAIERGASALQRALAAAVFGFGQALHQPDGVPRALRQRLAVAGGHVAALRESLARATASLDRAINVLIPEALTAPLYDTAGHSERTASSGSLRA